MVNLIYLDNAATTKIDPEVLDAMMPYLTEEFGNPGGVYSIGRKAQNAVDTARSQVANLIGAEPDQIIFTSGGSEANNLAIKSFLGMFLSKGIITDSAEHESVLKSFNSINSFSRLHFVGVNSYGSVEIPEFCGKITDKNDIGFASIMGMNNETGAENPIKEIGAICKDEHILFHTDCVQALGCMDLDVKEIGCGFMSMSSHKIHGPKGVGALFVKDRGKCFPLIDGGAAQEFGLRGGTENVAGIVGFGKACELVKSGFFENEIRVSKMKHLFYATLVSELASPKYNLAHIIHVNGPHVDSRGKTINLRFDGVDGQTLLLMLDSEGVCVSAGSACTSRENKPSHVLTAMGISADDARNSIRVSFSRMNTEEEVTEAARILAGCVNVANKSW